MTTGNDLQTRLQERQTDFNTFLRFLQGRGETTFLRVTALNFRRHPLFGSAEFASFKRAQVAALEAATAADQTPPDFGKFGNASEEFVAFKSYVVAVAPGTPTPSFSTYKQHRLYADWRRTDQTTGELPARTQAILESPAGQEVVGRQQARAGRAQTIEESGLSEADAVRFGVVDRTVAPEVSPTEGGEGAPLGGVRTETITLEDGRVFTAVIDSLTGQIIQLIPSEAAEAPDVLSAEFQADLEFREQQLAETSAANRLKADLERQRILAGLSGPRDWIKFWFATHPAGPSKREVSRESLRGVERSIAQQEEKVATLIAEGSGLNTEGLKEQADLLTLMNKGRARLIQRVREVSSAPEQALPRVPQQIAEFIPSIEGGERLRPARIRTPSAQQLGRTSPDTLQGLLGFADFSASRGASRTASGLLFDIERMKPGTRGQLSRLRPAQQRGG